MAVTNGISRPTAPIEFIAAITQHIPERLAQMVRYYGWYSNRMRDDRQRAALLQDESEKTEAENDEVIVISNFRTKKIPPLVWRGCIKKVWEVDPLLCCPCGGLMKIVSFIYEHRVTKKILAHLSLSEEAKSRRERAPSFPQTVETIIEPYDDGRSLRLPGLNMRRLSSMSRHYNRLLWDTVAKFQ